MKSQGYLVANSMCSPCPCPHEIQQLRSAPVLGAAFVLLMWMASCPATSLAQTVPSDKEETKEAILELPAFTVNAQKEPRPIQEVPMAIVALDSKKLDDFKLFSAADVQAVSPGLDVNQNNLRNTVPSMRGVTWNPDSGAAAAVDIYWNEIPSLPQSGFQAMYDVDQIEVLKGPQGTLRGRSSPAGAILINTRKPNYESYGASVQQTFSDQDLMNTQVSLNAPIIKNKVALRLAGLYNSGQGSGSHNVVTGLDSFTRTRSYRATLGLKPTDNLQITLVHQYMNYAASDYGIVQGSPTFNYTRPGQTTPVKPANLSPFDRISVNPGVADYDFRPILDTLTATLKLPGQHELTLIGGSHDLKMKILSENTNGEDIIPDYTNPQLTEIRSKTYSGELRFASVRHKFWDYVFGAYYEEFTNDSIVKGPTSYLWFDNFPNFFVSKSPTPIPPARVVSLNLVSTGGGSYRALFTTHTLKFNKQWKLETGLRYTMYERDGVQSDPALGLFSPSHVKESPTTGTVSLTYQPNKSTTTYMTIGRAFRAGGNNFKVSPTEPERYLRYDSESSLGYEAGIKGSWLENHLQANAAVFLQKFDGYIQQGAQQVATDTNGDGIRDGNYPLAFNADGEVKGVEVGVTVSLPHRIVLGFDGAYADARYTGGRIPATVIQNGTIVFNTPGEQVSYVSAKGQLMSDTPVFTLSTNAEWSKKVLNGELFIRGLFYYRGPHEVPNTVDRDFGGFGTVDLFTGYRSSTRKWSMTFWVKNLFDRQVVTRTNIMGTIGNWSAGYIRAFVIPEREMGVTASYSF